MTGSRHPRGTHRLLHRASWLIMMAVLWLPQTAPPLQQEEPPGPWIPGRPHVIVEAAGAEFLDGPEEGRFDLLLTLRNVGGLTAGRVTVTAAAGEAVSPVEGSGMAPAGTLFPDERTTVRLRMVGDNLDASGVVLLTLKLEYIDSEARRYTDEQTIRLRLAPRGWNRPLLIAAAYSLDPESPSPGQAFTLSLCLQNVGPGEARRLLVRLGGGQGLEPFAPLGSSNVRFLPSLAPGEAQTTTFRLLVDGTAEGGVYPLEINLAYENVTGETWTETQVIGILVIPQVSLEVRLFGELPEDLVVGEAFEVPVEVINTGRRRVDVGMVELVSADLDLREASQFVGPLDPGIAGSLVARAVPSRPGTVTVRVVVHYQDVLNRAQVVERELQFEVQPAPEPLSTPETGPEQEGLLQRLGRVLLGLLGLGG